MAATGKTDVVVISYVALKSPPSFARPRTPPYGKKKRRFTLFSRMVGFNSTPPSPPRPLPLPVGDTPGDTAGDTELDPCLPLGDVFLAGLCLPPVAASLRRSTTFSL